MLLDVQDAPDEKTEHSSQILCSVWHIQKPRKGRARRAPNHGVLTNPAQI